VVVPLLHSLYCVLGIEHTHLHTLCFAYSFVLVFLIPPPGFTVNPSRTQILTAFEQVGQTAHVWTETPLTSVSPAILP
jgi:hypothetical protein